MDRPAFAAPCRSDRGGGAGLGDFSYSELGQPWSAQLFCALASTLFSARSSARTCRPLQVSSAGGGCDDVHALAICPVRRADPGLICDRLRRPATFRPRRPGRGQRGQLPAWRIAADCLLPGQRPLPQAKPASSAVTAFDPWPGVGPELVPPAERRQIALPH